MIYQVCTKLNNNKVCDLLVFILKRKLEEKERMNSINLIGRITKDVEIKEFGKGKDKGLTCRFSLAVRRNKEVTDFINCVAFGATCELLENYVNKGDLLGVSGSLQENNYQDKDGNMQYGYNVIVNSISLIQPKTEEQETGRKYHR